MKWSCQSKGFEPPNCALKKRFVLGRYLRSRWLRRRSERFWLNFQVRYDIEVEKDRLGPALEAEVSVL